MDEWKRAALEDAIAAIEQGLVRLRVIAGLAPVDTYIPERMHYEMVAHAKNSPEFVHGDGTECQS